MINGKASLEDVRELIEAEIGSFDVVKYVSDGLNSEVSIIARADADITFIKGRQADHPWAWTQQRERAINPAVRSISPRIKWSACNSQWDLNGFEYIPGRHADYSPGSTDLPEVVRTLQQLQEIPCPGGEVKAAELGRSLLHTEWTPGNILVSDRAYLVDWAWPTRGAAWIDPACLVVWLIASGHSPSSAEYWAAKIPSWQSAPAISLDEFARIQGRMWAGIAEESSEPWTKSVAAASLSWSSHRNI